MTRGNSLLLYRERAILEPWTGKILLDPFDELQGVGMEEMLADVYVDPPKAPPTV